MQACQGWPTSRGLKQQLCRVSANRHPLMSKKHQCLRVAWQCDYTLEQLRDEARERVSIHRQPEEIWQGWQL
eukprot:6336421-Amphidinium_carterae.1